jgi:hypothetical protein
MGLFHSKPVPLPAPVVQDVDVGLSTIVSFIESTLRKDIMKATATGPNASRFYAFFDSAFEKAKPHGEQVLLEKLLAVRLQGANAIQFSPEKPTISRVTVIEDSTKEMNVLTMTATVQVQLASIAFQLEWEKHFFNLIKSSAPTDITLTNLVFDGTARITIDASSYPTIHLSMSFSNVVLRFDVGSIGVKFFDADISKLLTEFAHCLTKGIAAEIEREHRVHTFSMEPPPPPAPVVPSQAEIDMRARHARELEALKKQEAPAATSPTSSSSSTVTTTEESLADSLEFE